MTLPNVKTKLPKRSEEIIMLEKTDLGNPEGSETTKTIPEEYFELKHKIHDRLIDLIDLTVIDKLDQTTNSTNLFRRNAGISG